MFDIKTAFSRLLAIGLTTNEAHQILQEVQKWKSCGGEEWTVERLKSLKLNLLRRLSELPPLTTASWIRYDSKGIPKGPFSRVFRLAERNFGKGWNAIMIYTGFAYDHPELRVTAKQWKKAISAINRAPVDTQALIEGLALVHKSPFYVPISVRTETGEPLVLQATSETRRAPTYYRTVPEREGAVESLTSLVRQSVWSSQNWDILSGACAGLEDLVLPDIELNLEFERKAGGPLPEELPEMGIIALIPEPGYKLRFAANPMRVYQSALKPLGDALFAALKRVPNDFTFDQESGVVFIQSLLTKGYPSASMDLSNATDNAPLDLQLELLSLLGVSTRWLQFFKSCCRGTWHYNKTKHDRLAWADLRWSVGSPLGLYPTFASFALWHHSLVQGCFADSDAARLDDGRYPYAILGDDVWIGNLHVAELYRSRMVALGVPISEDKTLLSHSVGEFASRIITSNSVVQGIKWKGRVTNESFVDFARNIGPGALMLMKPRQRRVISFIADLPEPYGLGWNPLGIPLNERLTPLIESVWSRDERVRSFESRSSRINRNLYGYVGPSGGRIYRKVDVVELASDQEATMLTSHYLPGWEAWQEMWPNAVELALREKGEMAQLHRQRLGSVLQRNSSVERRSETPTLVVLERKIRSVLRQAGKTQF